MIEYDNQFNSYWEKDMNNQKIEQCKADIKALEENLKKLQDKEDKKFAWIDHLHCGSLVCSFNDMVYMLCDLSNGYEFAQVNGPISLGRTSSYLSGDFKSLNEVQKMVKSVAKMHSIIQPYKGNLQLTGE